MGLINGVLYTVSGLGILAEYFGFLNLGLTAILTPAALAVFGNVAAVVKAKMGK